ncbi:hypothetical protein [Intrasporangium sp. DVR]|uniref:hypothetical protein n=1 Tax=Intrasporangium sp. DVR TaxID=3127867 RepID=UPI00313A4FED
MRLIRSTVSIVGVAAVASLALAGPAAADPAPGPDSHASCIGLVFRPQAVGEPRTIADRIAYIKANELAEGESFGNVIGGWFAHADCSGG